MTRLVRGTDARIRRLVSSGICKGESAERYVAELKRLGKRAGEGHKIVAKERFFKALGDSTRLKIIGLLATREMCVCEVMVALGLSQPNASHHLGILEREGIARKRREGKWVLYGLTSSKILAMVDELQSRRSTAPQYVLSVLL